MAPVNRRNWLKQTSLALAGLGASGPLLARQQPWAEVLPEQEAEPIIIRIGQNENPYGPGKAAQKAMMGAIAKSNRYAGDLATELREKIARQHGLTPEHVLLGAGSSELLGNTAALASKRKGNAVSADPTFRLWFGAAENLGLSIKKVPLTPGKLHDLEAMLAAMDGQTSMVYVVNPHNPTGTLLPDTDLRLFAEKVTKQSLLLLDEAYTEYAGVPTLANMVADNKNLVVAKTFSKIYGLAGARVGYALAHPATIKALAEWQPWANAGPSVVGMAGALAALHEEAFVQYSRQQNEKVRHATTQALKNMGFEVIPSVTNFLYYNAAPFKGNLAEVMRQANFSAIRQFEPGTSWVRTSLGTMAEMEKFLQVLKQNMV